MVTFFGQKRFLVVVVFQWRFDSERRAEKPAMRIVDIESAVSNAKDRGQCCGAGFNDRLLQVRCNITEKQIGDVKAQSNLDLHVTLRSADREWLLFIAGLWTHITPDYCSE